MVLVLSLPLILVMFPLPWVLAELPLPRALVVFPLPLVLAELPAVAWIAGGDDGAWVPAALPGETSEVSAAHSAIDAAMRPPTASSTLVVESKKPRMRVMSGCVDGRVAVSTGRSCRCIRLDIWALLCAADSVGGRCLPENTSRHAGRFAFSRNRLASGPGAALKFQEL